LELGIVLAATNGDDFFVTWSDNGQNVTQGIYARQRIAPH
jgi:hypothetical protein